jgi:uncharacterized protein involved in cysteine biosynthesis
MTELFAAFSRSLRDLSRGEILWHALWPPLASLALWLTAGYTFWSEGQMLMASIVPQLPWTGWEWVARWAAIFLMLAALAALIYITAIMLVAIFALPRMISLVAARDYPELGRHGENVFWNSLTNTLAAGAIFILGSLVLPLLWGAWLNQRTFRFDALAEHASAGEMQHLARAHRSGFYTAGLVTAAAAHLPLVNLLVPAFTALVFVHLGLAGLRRLRLEQGIQL